MTGSLEGIGRQIHHWASGVAGKGLSVDDGTGLPETAQCSKCGLLLIADTRLAREGRYGAPLLSGSQLGLRSAGQRLTRADLQQNRVGILEDGSQCVCEENRLAQLVSPILRVGIPLVHPQAREGGADRQLERRELDACKEVDQLDGRRLHGG